MIGTRKDPAARPSRIVCYAESGDELSVLTPALDGFDVVRAEGERETREALRQADVLLLVVRGTPSTAWRTTVARLRRAFPGISFVLVTERDPAVAEWTVGLTFEGPVWMESVGDDLKRGLTRASTVTAFEQMAGRVVSSNLPTGLRRALSLALRQTLDEPFRSLQHLADALGRSVVTLRQEFGPPRGSKRSASIRPHPQRTFPRRDGPRASSRLGPIGQADSLMELPGQVP